MGEGGATEAVNQMGLSCVYFRQGCKDEMNGLCSTHMGDEKYMQIDSKDKNHENVRWIYLAQDRI
jgi:hypothetical protein